MKIVLLKSSIKMIYKFKKISKQKSLKKNSVKQKFIKNCGINYSPNIKILFLININLFRQFHLQIYKTIAFYIIFLLKNTNTIQIPIC